MWLPRVSTSGGHSDVGSGELVKAEVRAGGGSVLVLDAAEDAVDMEVELEEGRAVDFFIRVFHSAAEVHERHLVSGLLDGFPEP